jgi:hypothetical protein
MTISKTPCSVCGTAITVSIESEKGRPKILFDRSVMVTSVKTESGGVELAVCCLSCKDKLPSNS